ncbi:MAG: type 1 glutamine amidotransferase, partial [Candidatus Bathyarchaeota archaeon]|nr:type 1 glutamine amidotransferase [Candidatus Bathyarchaeota archaeon]
YLRMLEEGAEVKVIAVKREVFKGKHGLSIEANLSVGEANPEDFNCVIIPGGWAPDRLRREQSILNFVRGIYKRGGVVAAICHGPQVLISAGILKGRRVTCVSAIKDDVINAGAIYEDSPVVRDGNIITSRVLGDLPFFCREIIKALSS